jgi:hypothetical protein
MAIHRETGKDRWRRVPKDYFRSPDRLQSAKRFASGLACLLALGWFASGFDIRQPFNGLATDANSLRANHGTLARVHATWDNRCEACHIPFESIHGEALFASSSTPSSHSSDKLCASCHAGPIHHASVIESEVKSCAGCHRDHEGRDVSLVRMPDGECTTCHSALSDHRKSSAENPRPRSFGNVIRFDVDHPAFVPDAVETIQGEPRDRSRLKFNHSRHMMPGLVARPGDSPYQVEDIPLAESRARYQGAGRPQDPVQLDCSSCHHLDANERSSLLNSRHPSASIPDRDAGRYYLPISYENDCRGCHTLTFDPAQPKLEVPHGVSPAEVVDFLKRTYAADVLAEEPKSLDVFVPPVRVPGHSVVPETARRRLERSVGRALKSLFPASIEGAPPNANSCLECHHYAGSSPAGIPTGVEPTRVPEVWFTHASFDHKAHRGVSCRDCHARSYALKEDGHTPLEAASTRSSDVLIPAIDNCRTCHAPARSPGGWFASAPSPPGGGAAYDCTECHRYHNGDRFPEGTAVLDRDAELERTLAEFLGGRGGHQRRPGGAKSPTR